MTALSLTSCDSIPTSRGATIAGEDEGYPIRDDVFKQPKPVVDFNFGERVAKVFDDMLDRSVPFCQETQRRTAEMARGFVVPHTRIYDLGCSTGTTFVNLAAAVPSDVQFIGVDNSKDMLQRCRANLGKAGVRQDVQLIDAGLNQGVAIENGCLMLVEKLLGEHSLFN